MASAQRKARAGYRERQVKTMPVRLRTRPVRLGGRRNDWHRWPGRGADRRVRAVFARGAAASRVCLDNGSNVQNGRLGGPCVPGHSGRTAAMSGVRVAIGEADGPPRNLLILGRGWAGRRPAHGPATSGLRRTERPEARDLWPLVARRKARPAGSREGRVCGREGFSFALQGARAARYFSQRLLTATA